MKKVRNGAIAITACVLMISALITIIISLIEATGAAPARALFSLLSIPQAAAAIIILKRLDRLIDREMALKKGTNDR